MSVKAVILLTKADLVDDYGEYLCQVARVAAGVDTYTTTVLFMMLRLPLETNRCDPLRNPTFKRHPTATTMVAYHFFKVAFLRQR